MSNFDESASRRTRPSTISKLALALGATLFCLGFIELTLRIFEMMSPSVTLSELKEYRQERNLLEVNLGSMITATDDRLLAYGLIPDLHVFFGGKRVDINSAGYRDDEFHLEKPANTLRVTVIGDSGSFGWKVAKEDAYPEVLEAMLNRHSKGLRFEVMNFAVPGYNSVMERAVLEQHALAYDPDIVIVQFDGNDVDVPNFMKPPKDPWSVKRSLLYEFVAARMKGAQQKEPRQEMPGLKHVPLEIDEHGGFRFAIEESELPDSYREMIGVENATNAIRGIGKACTERGIDWIFLLNPAHVDDYTLELSMLASAGARPFVTAARDTGAVVIDPGLVQKRALDREGLTHRAYWVDPSTEDAHAIPARHAWIAFSLARALLEYESLHVALGTPDSERAKTLLADLAARAESQSPDSGRPRADSSRALRITVGDEADDARYIGSGWHPVESFPIGSTGRWTSGEAELRLPAASRLILQVSAERPAAIQPETHQIEVNGRALPYTVTRVGNYNWLDVTVPPAISQQPLRVKIQAQPIEIPGVDLPRELGLLVLSVDLESSREQHTAPPDT